MKTGRNDPCPCGSGKKYKQCCLEKQTPALAPTEMAWRRIRRELEDSPSRMLRFIAEAYGTGAVEEAWFEFLLWDNEAPGFDPQSPHMSVFMPWLLHCWSPNSDDTEVADTDLHEIKPTQAYLKHHGHKLAPVLRDYLQSCLQRLPSFYEVEHCEPGHDMALRDLLTGERHDVLERNATLNLRTHDVLYAQLASTDGITLMEATSPVKFPSSDKIEIIDLRRRMRDDLAADQGDDPLAGRDLREIWDIELRDLYLTLSEAILYPLPQTYQTSDGEALEFHKLIFNIDSAQLAFDALKDLDMRADATQTQVVDVQRDVDGIVQSARIDWVKASPSNELGSYTVHGTIMIKGKRLMAEVASRERAERFKRMLDKLPAAHAKFLVDELQTPDHALADANASPPRMLPQTQPDDPEAQALLVSYMQAHYSRWLDDPLPALNGRTPRQVAKSPEGREQVEALVQDAEQHDLGLGPSAHAAIFDDVRLQWGLLP